MCPNCHNVPKAAEWMALPQSVGLHVFHVGQRTGHFLHWEPIYVGTHAEPPYDERLSWEGKSDKMTQVNVSSLKKISYFLLNIASILLVYYFYNELKCKLRTCDMNAISKMATKLVELNKW